MQPARDLTRAEHVRGRGADQHLTMMGRMQGQLARSASFAARATRLVDPGVERGVDAASRLSARGDGDPPRRRTDVDALVEAVLRLGAWRIDRA